MAKQMTDGVRKAVERFCLTGGIYTCILMALKCSLTTDTTERRSIVFIMVGFAMVSMVYCFARIVAEGKMNKETSNS